MGTHSSITKIEIIEAFRFFAALAIVFVHIPIVGVGHFGVDIFFVISGLVMMVSTHKNYKKFFTKRLIRILPTYYIVTLGVFLIAFFAPSLLNNTTADFSHLIKSLIFLPFDKNGTGHHPILFLGWTLNFEMYFYALFAIALKISHAYRGSITTILLFIIWLATRNISDLPLSAYSNSMIFEFILGMLIYHILFNKNYIQTAIMSLTIIIGLYLFENFIFDRSIKYGFTAFIIILFSVKFSRFLKIPKFLIQLGGASYMLYLTHPYVIQFFYKLTNLFSGTTLEKFSALILSLFIVNVIALVLFNHVEIPIRNYLRRKLL